MIGVGRFMAKAVNDNVNRSLCVLNRKNGQTQPIERIEKNGRGDWIRTSDPLFPKQMRYQAALLPDLMEPSIKRFYSKRKA